MPAIGDTRTAPCSWCGRPDVLQTFIRYPLHTDLKGGFWDASNCSCAAIVNKKDEPPVIARLARHGFVIVESHKARASEPRKYKNGKPLKGTP